SLESGQKRIREGGFPPRPPEIRHKLIAEIHWPAIDIEVGTPAEKVHHSPGWQNHLFQKRGNERPERLNCRERAAAETAAAKKDKPFDAGRIQIRSPERNLSAPGDAAEDNLWRVNPLQ